MNTIRTGLLVLAVSLLGASCGDSEDGDGATAAATGGEAGLAGTGGEATSDGGHATTGGTGGVGGEPSAGGDASGGTGGTVSSDQVCADVCDLLASRTVPLTCVPSPCLDTCTSKYNVAAEASDACGAAYLALLACGSTKPADSWECYDPYPGSGVIISVPPHSSGPPDGCQPEFDTLYSTVTTDPYCLTAFLS